MTSQPLPANASELGHPDLAVAVEGAILRVTIDRPERKNAFTQAMYAAFTAALRHADSDDAIRVVRVEGAGGLLSSGNDLKEFAAFAMGDPLIGLGEVLAFLDALATLRKPLIVAVEGWAVGVGATMLLHADLVVAADTAKLRFPFVDLGLVPEAGSSMLLPALVGPARAAELLMLGDVLDPDDAHRLGLVTRVVPAHALGVTTDALASALASKPPTALQATKALLRAPRREALRAHIRVEAERFAACLKGPEVAEALRAFAERRAPDFSPR